MARRKIIVAVGCMRKECNVQQDAATQVQELKSGMRRVNKGSLAQLKECSET
jgi:hypothetical protein